MSGLLGATTFVVVCVIVWTAVLALLWVTFQAWTDLCRTAGIPVWSRGIRRRAVFAGINGASEEVAVHLRVFRKLELCYYGAGLVGLALVLGWAVLVFVAAIGVAAVVSRPVNLSEIAA